LGGEGGEGISTFPYTILHYHTHSDGVNNFLFFILFFIFLFFFLRIYAFLILNLRS